MLAFGADIDVVVVAHNNLATLRDTLCSLTEAGCPDSQITVVDVASTDATTAWLEAARPAVHRITLAENNGPGPGRNAGIRAASRRFVLLMDADVRVQPEAVQRLHAAMLEDAAVKIGSPIVVHASAPDRIQYAGGQLHYICEAIIPWAERPLIERGAHPEDIGVAATCALLLDREAAFTVGLFDERYFIGKEDGDFTHRMNLAGYRIRELPDAIVLHESRSRGSWLFFYQIRNRWHFILKNYQLRTIVTILPALVIYEPLQLLVLTAQGRLWTYMRAVAGLIGMLPTLSADRARVRAVRRRSDRELLSSAPLIVRGDIARNVVVRHGKPLYDRFLSFYWRVLTEADARQ